MDNSTATFVALFVLVLSLLTTSLSVSPAFNEANLVATSISEPVQPKTQYIPSYCLCCEMNDYITMFVSSTIFVA